MKGRVTVVLVGHSFCGYNVRRFAGMNTGEVGGVVLVDASHPEEESRTNAILSPEQLAAQTEGIRAARHDVEPSL